MNDRNPQKLQNKLKLQALALMMIVLPPIGLVFTVAADSRVATWALLVVVVVGNLLGMWVS